MNNLTVLISGSIIRFIYRQHKGGGKGMSNNNIIYNPSDKQVLLTKKGLDRLKDQLNRLNKERISMCKRLMKMDSKEKEEYVVSTDALNVLERNEGEIQKISDILQRADIVTEASASSDVRLGSTVRLLSGSKTAQYTVVNTIEADPSENKISPESPLGQALIGKKKRDKILMSSPGGQNYHYRLQDIL